MRENLIKSRKAQCFTQAQIAGRVGISTRQYQAIEAGTSYSSVKVWYSLKELLEQKE